jgi:hypothetical protein
MADMVVVSNRTQALALPYHSDCLAPLVSGQLWLASEFDGSLLRGGAATIGTSKNAASFVLRQSRQERQNALTERRGQIQPLQGLALLIPAHAVDRETEILWMREMIGEA